MKRHPALFDRFLAAAPEDLGFGRKFGQTMQAHVFDASKAIINREAAGYLADMLREIPETVAYGQEFAISPHTKFWLEIPNYDFFWERLNERPPNEFGEESVAYYINGPRAYVVAGSRELVPTKPGQMSLVLLPIEYRLNQPFADHEVPPFARELFDDFEPKHVGARAAIDVFFWGSSLNKAKLGIDDLSEKLPEWIGALRAQHSFRIMEGVTTGKVRFEYDFRTLFDTSAGDLRIILGLLLFLNRTRKYTYTEEIAPSRGFIKARPALFMKHSVIKISLDPMPMLIKQHQYREDGGGHKRNHKVRGHFCHDLIARTHCYRSPTNDHNGYYYHVWKELEHTDPRYRPGRTPNDEALTWRCLNCGGWKWWRNECRRGDASLGIVDQLYEVTV